jgi:hypothetical protein
MGASLAKDLSFGLPFFYRVVLPGTLIGSAALPLIRGAFTRLGISIVGTDTQAALAALVAVAIGFVLSVLDDPIYQFYEGRRGWPDWLARDLTAGWTRRVRFLQEEADKAKKCGDTATYDELWYEIRQYPTDDEGTYIATRPTKMGNILASYESYPERRYGMDSVFYWYRLWLKLDKDTRGEVDRLWASTDGLLYLAAGALGLGAVYLAVAGAAALAAANGASWTLTAAEQTFYALGGLLLMLASHVPYRLSISGHLQNGETFKSLFDLYRSKLAADLVPADAKERARWTTIWAALQYGIDEPAERRPRPTVPVLLLTALVLVVLLRGLTNRDG